MSVTTTKFIRKPLYVDAVRITRANFEEIAAWCQGEIQQDEVPGKGTSKPFIRVRVHNPKNPRQTKAMVGDWLLYTERGYKVYTNKAFLESFDEVETDDERIGLYGEGEPSLADEARDHPDIVVIGDECFAQIDGSVLNWKGVNYVPQEESTNGSLNELAEAAREAEALEEQRTAGLQGPTPEFVPATPEGIAEAARETDAARAEDEKAI